MLFFERHQVRLGQSAPTRRIDGVKVPLMTGPESPAINAGRLGIHVAKLVVNLIAKAIERIPLQDG
jgi:hypothetical protein